ncbi:unnamed protein product [Notodromas monacha]|uniref:RING-type domain-containing protein n=1 Tax=Notodromas monacha TaxID=399045 RepID=A0A7R9BHP0_9CRUS|nr:unnamed protein product [Notodromas monacha]CAG0915677.1 unnamed protein product [Notodromas monacha]
MAERSSSTSDQSGSLISLSGAVVNGVDGMVSRLPSGVSEGIQDQVSIARDSFSRFGAGIHQVLNGLHHQLERRSFPFSSGASSDSGAAEDVETHSLTPHIQASDVTPSVVIETGVLRRTFASQTAPDVSRVPPPVVNSSTQSGDASVEMPLIADASNGSGSGNELASRRGASQEQPQNEFLAFFAQISQIIFVLLMKVLYTYSIGILAFLGFTIICTHANRVVIREFARHTKRSLSSLGIAAMNAWTAIVFTHFVLTEKVYPYLLLIPTCENVSKQSLFDILWILLICDHTIRLLTTLLKIAIVASPMSVVPNKKRGKLFFLTEMASQTYRAMIPSSVWFYFLGGGCVSMSWLCFDGFLAFLYAIYKLNFVYKRVKELRQGLIVFLYRAQGAAPTAQDLEEANHMCPICHDSFQRPAKMECGHVFCDDCIELWMDRENNCPMCRAALRHDSAWRDGHTSYCPMIF